MKFIQKLKKDWKRVCLLLVLFFQTNLTISAQPINAPTVDAHSALIINGETGQILFEKDSDEAVEVGAASKLLSLYLVSKALINEEITWETSVPISDYAYNVSQDYNIPNVPLRQDVNYTVEELYEAAVINSANGAMIALAELIADDEATFVEMMNQQLAEWDLENNQIINATGLTSAYEPYEAYSDEEGSTNALTAEALGLVAYHLLSETPEILQFSYITQKLFKSGTSDAFAMNNFNRLLPDNEYGYNGVDGLMTGYSPQEGYSIVTSAERNDIRIIALLLGNETDEGRYSEARDLLDYSFGFFKNLHLAQADNPVTQVSQVRVANGFESTAPLVFAEDLILTVPLTYTSNQLEYAYTGLEEYHNENGQLLTPISAETVVGSVSVNIRNQTNKYLPYTYGEHANVAVSADLEEAPWYTQTWNNFSNSFSNSMESIRVFFTELFN